MKTTLLSKNARFKALMILMLILIAPASHVFGGDHWYSGVFTEEGQRLLIQKDEQETNYNAPLLFDVAISLNIENPPEGDSDLQTQDERTPYEQIIQYFADAIYEATNGAHRVRNVYLISNKYTDLCDILWSPYGNPGSSISGFNNSGTHIHMFSNFDGINLLENPELGGYILAHEWGHYYYGLYDEYPSLQGQRAPDGSLYDDIWHYPHSNDNESMTSLMNNPWNAITESGTDYRWLNFSSSTESDYSKKNAQYRVYRASAWETLARHVAHDPKSMERLCKPPRVHYANLDSVATTGIEHEFDYTDQIARDELTIIWTEETLINQIVIDRSGSMSGSKIQNVKNAAKLLVDHAEIGSTKIGVIQFNNKVEVVVPVTEINSELDKNSIKTKIDSIVATGATAIGEAANKALVDLQALNEPAEQKVVFLLSDGLSNTGRLPQTVIPDYQQAKIPLITFAYGNDADQNILRQMAEQTAGRFYFSPIELSEINQVFDDANQLISQTRGILASTTIINSGSPQSFPIIVDSTINLLEVVVTYAGSTSGATFKLYSPTGVEYFPQSVISSGNESLAQFAINAPNFGEWTLVAQANSPSVEVTVQANGQPANRISYSISLLSVTGKTIQYPTPILLVAVLEKELPIAGAVVTGQVKGADGKITPLDFRDDGIAPDVTANDGRYSTILDYNKNGYYNISVSMNNSQGTARLTYNGIQPAIGPNGSLEFPQDVPITEAFSRTAKTQITVQGYRSDDHGNDPDSATILPANNGDIPGRIDSADDVDVFWIPVSPDNPAVAVRVTDYAFGMDPSLKIVGSDKTRILNEGTLDGNASDEGYLYLLVNEPTETSYFAYVSNIQQTAKASYNISAGPSIGSEQHLKVGTSLRIDQWQLKLNPNSGKQDQMKLSGEINAPPGKLALSENGMSIGFADDAVSANLHPEFFQKKRGAAYTYKNQTAKGRFLVNVGGSSRSQYSVKLKGSFDALQSIEPTGIKVACGDYNDETIIKNRADEIGSEFTLAKDSSLEPEFFVDALIVQRRLDKPDSDSIRLSGRLSGCAELNPEEDTLIVSLGFLTIEIPPGAWETNEKGTILVAKGSLGGRSNYVLKINNEKHTLSLSAKNLSLQDITSEISIGISYGLLARINTLILNKSSNGHLERYIY